MPSSDVVGDMIAIIKNANSRKHQKTSVPHSRYKEGVASVLKAEGYITDFKVIQDEKKKERKTLWIYLKYDTEGQRVITDIVRISKPGKRVFRGMDNVGKVLDGLGISILSTNRGILSNRQAKKQKVGGELICRVW